ncbi:hypothetical protein I316_00607 [Kwoniella heveanensis BCC8398]|uniref:Uncharacterized protein n=1 Tax=Kwoniella heveanensis BCC8398 TaxID=1296120 RepID=A0A1B9H2I5_9TREE|nr:hypothetical protein I316_00607 [Kwoniella heveanensis BCC8398]
MAPYRYRHESPFKAARRRGGRRRSRSVDEESLIGLVQSNRFSSDSLPSQYSQLSANKPLSGQRLNYDAKQADLSVRGHNGNDPGKTTPGDEERDKAAPLAAIDQANSDTFNSIVRPPVLSKRLLIGWRICILLPFLAAGCLLYLLTCSAPSWRSDWSVVKVKLEKNEWTPIYQHGKMLSGGGENIEIADQEGGSTTEDGDNGRGGGWLSVNMWGWCLQDASASETICSGENMWFDLDELLGEESSRSSAPSGDDFNFLLTHGLVIHGFGMLAAMMALIPIGLNTFRMIRAKDPTYVIDRCLKSSVADNLTNHTVKSG